MWAQALHEKAEGYGVPATIVAAISTEALESHLDEMDQRDCSDWAAYVECAPDRVGPAGGFVFTAAEEAEEEYAYEVGEQIRSGSTGQDDASTVAGDEDTEDEE